MSQRSQRRGRRPDAERGVAAEEVGADELFGEAKSRRRASAAHKDEQLCEQVFQILSVALGELEDERLRELVLESVTMGPDAGRLVVTLIAPGSAGQGGAPLVDSPPAFPFEEVLLALQRSKGHLRSEIAAGIHRKRTPELSFRLLTREEVQS
jgi:ribosome-binding factor A